VVLEVLRQVAERACRRDRLDAAPRRGPSELGELRLEGGALLGRQDLAAVLIAWRLPRALVRDAADQPSCSSRATSRQAPSRPPGTTSSPSGSASTHVSSSGRRRQRLLVHPRPADDEDLIVDRRRERERLRDARRDEHAVVAAPSPRSRDDDRRPPGSGGPIDS
jgi:hypothetical protein